MMKPHRCALTLKFYTTHEQHEAMHKQHDSLDTQECTEAYLTPYSSLPEWMDESVPSMTAEERTEWITHEKTPVTDH